MVSSHFQSILKEFEPYFQCPLEAGELESCIISMDNGIEIQIELNANGLVLIGSSLGLLLGRYRDLVFKEALKSNTLYPPSTGVFGYSEKTKNLILFIQIDPKSLKPDTIPALMDPFVVKAKLWADAIAQGTVPAVQQGAKAAKSDNIFGIQR